MNFLALSYWDVALAALLLTVNGALSLWLRLGLERQLAISAVRMVVQLTLVGLILKTLFALVYPWMTALAAAVMAFPLMVRAMRLSIETVDRKLETAARTLGASRANVFVTITLPLIMPGILAGAVLAFARSLGEFGATITFVSNIPQETRTLPLALYSLIQSPDGEAGALRLVVLSVLLSLAALGASEAIARRLRARISD